MSNAKPLRPVKRAMNYMDQNGGQYDLPREPRERVALTPAQRRRIKHKNHKMLGVSGGGVVKARQVKTRQARPAPVPGGLLALLSPKQIRKAVAARSERRGIKFSVKSPAGQTMIIDDPIRMGNGDR